MSTTESADRRQPSGTAALRSVVFSPRSFFRTIEPSVRRAAFVVALPAVLSALGFAIALVQYPELYPLSDASMFLTGLATNTLYLILGAYVAWVPYAVAFFALTALLGGSGSFRDMFALIGWGFLPQAVAGAALILLGYFDLHAIGLYVEPVMLLWSVSLWTEALTVSQDVSRLRAIVSVAFPVLATVALFFVGIYSIGGI